MPPDSRFPLSVGDRFGGSARDRFEVKSQAGLGGQAVVFRCLDTRLNREVAAKVSTAMGHGDRRVAMERFERELQLSARVNHPHVLQVYDCGELPDGSPFVLLEWMDHGSLAGLVDGLMERGKMLPLEFVRYYSTALAASLRAVHATSMIHRDIKPDNVLIGADGVAKLTDFGIAKDIGPQAVQLTEVGQTLGTLGFMSPEQLSGLPGPQSDIFSFGVTVYAVLMSRMPDQVSQNAIPLGRIKDEAWIGVPPGFARLLKKCTAFELDHRYEGFSQVLDDLRALSINDDCRTQPRASKSLPPLPSGAFVTGMDTSHHDVGQTDPELPPVPGIEPTRAMDATSGAQNEIATKAGLDRLTGGQAADDGATRYFPANEFDRPKQGGGKKIAIAALGVLLLAGGGFAALQLGGSAAPTAADISRAAMEFDAAALRGDDRAAAKAAAALPATAVELPESKVLLAQDALLAGKWDEARGLAAQATGLPGESGALALLIEGAAHRLGGAAGYGAAAASYSKAAACSAPGCGPLADRAKSALGDLCLALPPGSPGCASVRVPESERDRHFARSLVLKADGHGADAKVALLRALGASAGGGASCLEAAALEAWAADPSGLDGGLRGQVASAGRAAARDDASCRLYGGL